MVHLIVIGFGDAKALVNNSTFVNNVSSQYGGAIHNNDSLSMTNSTLFDNSAPNGDGYYSNACYFLTRFV